MITLRPGSSMREYATWWQTPAETARVDLTGVTLDVADAALPFAVTVDKVAQPAPVDFVLLAPDTTRAQLGTTGWIRVRATFGNGDVEMLPDIPVQFA